MAENKAISRDQELFFSFLKEKDIELIKKNAPSFNENYIKNLIQRHRLVPYFYKIKDVFVPSLKEYIEIQNQKNARKMLRFAGEVFLIHESCQHSKINPVFLKGPALAYELYNDFSARQMVDLDIFVNRRDLKILHGALLNLGYQPTEIPKTWFKKFILKDNYYFHPNKKVSLEIHYRFFPNKFLDTKFKSLFFELTKKLTIQKREIDVLNTEANLLFLILHGSNHQWFRLFWLKDLADFISLKEIDWQRVINKSKKLGIENTLIQSVCLANKFFGLSIPNEIQNIRKNSSTENYLIDKAVKSIISPVNENILIRIRRLIYLTKLSDKMVYKWYILIGGLLRFIGR